MNGDCRAGAALLPILCLSVLPVANAQDWPHWRGPRYDGWSPATGLPAKFDAETNLAWRCAMPGPAACTPIVVGDAIFLSSVDTERERLVAMRVDAATGEIVWQRDADSGYRPGEVGSRVAGGRRSNYASPSPTTDGERVVFFFGNGDLVSYDFDGEEQWRRNVCEDYGDFAFQWTFSASPTLWRDMLVLPVLQRDVEVQRRRQRGGPQAEPGREGIESFLLGLDPATGETRYRHLRPSDARVESRESYATPIPYVGDDDRAELLIVGGDVITGHVPETGEELWRWGTWNEAHRERWWRLVPSPVVGDGVALVCAPKRAPVFAVRLGGEGLQMPTANLWRSSGRPNPVSSDVPTPAFADGHFYVLSDVQSALSKVSSVDGEVVWTTELSKDTLWRASPTIADGHVYCMNHGGEVVVVDAETGDITHHTALGEPDDDLTRSSIVAARGGLFVRTNQALFHFAE